MVGTYDPKHPDKEKKEEFHHDTAEQQMNKRNMTTSSYTQISRKKHQRNIGNLSFSFVIPCINVYCIVYNVEASLHGDVV